MKETTEKLDRAGPKAVADKSARIPRTHQHGSVWEHLLYGLATAMVTAGPLLIPGVTFEDWVWWFFGSVMGIYIVICLLAAWKCLFGRSHSQRRIRGSA